MEKNQDYSYYHDMKPIIRIIEDESYLKLCPKPGIRKLYLDCVHAFRNLYNRYMTAVR